MAVVGTMQGRVLLQMGDAEPVEVGTVEIPVHVSTEPMTSMRGRSEHTMDVYTDSDTTPADIAAATVRAFNPLAMSEGQY